jgi:SAM-dependent methyltransferase
VTDPTWPTRHGEEVAATLREGDPASIKRLYVSLGEHLERDYGADVTAAPLLSLPETGPVVVRLLRNVTGTLLDAGCGPNPGVAMALAVAPGRSVVALDIGLGTVRLAVARAAGDGMALHGVVGDVEALPFRTGAFAGGVCDDTIEHLPDDDAGAGELRRVLRPGGRMVLATPNRHSLSVLLRRLRDTVRRRSRPAAAYYVAESHLREYTWPELERLVAPHLDVRARATVGWSGGLARRVATPLLSVPGGRRLSRMIVVALEPRPATSGQPPS